MGAGAAMRRKLISLTAIVAFLLTTGRIAGAERAWQPRSIDPSQMTIVDHKPAPEFLAAKRMRTAGIVLTVIGIPFAVIAALSAFGISGGRTPAERQLSIAGTVTAGVIGLSLLGPGIPLWAIGQSDMDAIADRPMLTLRGGPPGSFGQSLALVF